MSKKKRNSSRAVARRRKFFQKKISWKRYVEQMKAANLKIPEIGVAI